MKLEPNSYRGEYGSHVYIFKKHVDIWTVYRFNPDENSEDYYKADLTSEGFLPFGLHKLWPTEFETLQLAIETVAKFAEIKEIHV